VIKVVSGGLYTSIQDLGRFGYRRLGVPLAGAMDRYSARLANRLVGNKKDVAVMEITHIGPVLHFINPIEIAITGAGFSPTVNNVEIPLNTRIFIQAESILKFGLPGYGLRAYLSVSDGFSSEKVLNSFSQHQGITTKETLEKGDELMVQSFVGVPSKVTASVKISKDRFTAEVLEVYKGPEFNLASKTLQKKLIETRLTVTSDSNRMAYMLKGWEEFSANEIITAPVQPGTVQLTPSGQCIVLMRDAQTTGGYARVLQLTEKSINRLAQKNTGTTLNFKLI
jgi:biotin-dependent carboxylase-like uncharacterized protein